ncbi:MAG: hypothetical protein DDT26_02333 [Dehalococcoidia bacterium]|nr:hypothetical protein [Chloroflexota bacterium]
MELSGHIAYLVKKAGFDIHVDVFESCIKPQLAAFDLLSDGDEPRNDEFRLFLGDYSLPPEHPGVGDRAGDILSIESLIKGDGGGVILCQPISLHYKSAAQGFHSLI